MVLPYRLAEDSEKNPEYFIFHPIRFFIFHIRAYRPVKSLVLGQGKIKIAPKFENK
jgi:hypothetical protein